MKKREGYIDYKILTEEGDEKVPGTESKSISLGVIMKLGDKYSRDFGLQFTQSNNSKSYPKIGSYAVGVSRLLYSIIHQNRRSVDGSSTIVWPYGVEPFTIGIIGLNCNPSYLKDVYNTALSYNLSPILEDTSDSLGTKSRRLESMGVPYVITVGNREERNNSVGVKESYSGNRYELKINDFSNLCRWKR